MNVSSPKTGLTRQKGKWSGKRSNPQPAKDDDPKGKTNQNPKESITKRTRVRKVIGTIPKAGCLLKGEILKERLCANRKEGNNRQRGAKLTQIES